MQIANITLTNRQEQVCFYIIAGLEAKCRDYALSKMKDEDFISIKEIFEFSGKVNENYPTVTKGRETFTIRPSSREKFDKYFTTKLENMVID